MAPLKCPKFIQMSLLRVADSEVILDPPDTSRAHLIERDKRACSAPETCSGRATQKTTVNAFLGLLFRTIFAYVYAVTPFNIQCSRTGGSLYSFTYV